MQADRERYRREFESLSLERQNHAVTKALSFIPSGSAVLEFGCNAGYVSRLLVGKGCTVIGVEIDEWAANEAREFCEEIMVGDMCAADVWQAIEKRRFDVALFGDVLEHLADPKPVLERTRHVLRPGGFIVTSVPNIAHWTIRLALLHGDFDYQPTGILDETHLRHYTLKSLGALLEESGYRMVATDSVRHPFRRRLARPYLRQWPFWISPRLRSILSREDATAFQYVIKAVPLNGPARGRAAVTPE